jgi:hypothetical protein
MPDVVNNRAGHRYELTVDGYLAATYYKLSMACPGLVHGIDLLSRIFDG